MTTITNAIKGNEGRNGNFFWDLRLDDGRNAWGLFKFDPEVGEEVVVVEEKDGKTRVKRPEKEFDGQPSQNSSRGASKDFKADPEKLRDENWRSCLHAAVACASGTVTSTQGIIEVANQFYDALLEKTSEPGPSGPEASSDTGGAATVSLNAHPQIPVSDSLNWGEVLRERIVNLAPEESEARKAWWARCQNKLASFRAEKPEDLSDADAASFNDWLGKQTFDDDLPF